MACGKKKYELGVQKAYVPEGTGPSVGGTGIASGLSMAGTGAQIGSAFGPVGMGIGAAAGLVGGGIAGILGAKKQKNDLKREQERVKSINDYVDQQSQYDINATNYVQDDNQPRILAQNGMYFQGAQNLTPNYMLEEEYKGPSHANGGIDKTLEIPSGSKIYRKPVEVEGGELQIRDDKGNISIIPKNKAKEAKQYLKNGDDMRLQALISKLPKDEPKDGKYQNGGQIPGGVLPFQQWVSSQYPNSLPKFGVDGLYGKETAGAYNQYGGAYNDFLAQQAQPQAPTTISNPVSNPYSNLSVSDPNLSQNLQNADPSLNLRFAPNIAMNPVVGSISPNVSLSPSPTSTLGDSLNQPIPQVSSAMPNQSGSMDLGGIGGKVGMGALSAVQALPAIYNLGKGLFGKVDYEDPNYIDLEEVQYQDQSDPQRQAVREAVAAQNFNAGNVATNAAQANQIQAANRFRGLRQNNQIDQQEAARRNQVEAQNVDIRNREEILRKQELDRVTALNRQAQENQQNYLETSLGQFGQLAGIGQQGVNMKTRDQAMQQRDQNQLQFLSNMYGLNGNSISGLF